MYSCHMTSWLSFCVDKENCYDGFNSIRLQAADMWHAAGLSLVQTDPFMRTGRVTWRVESFRSGDGNLNMVFIVEGTHKTIIVKQALPWLRAGAKDGLYLWAVRALSTTSYVRKPSTRVTHWFRRSIFTTRKWRCLPWSIWLLTWFCVRNWLTVKIP